MSQEEEIFKKLEEKGKRQEVSELATLSDLLGSSATRKVFIANLGKQVEIRKATIGEVAEILQKARDNLLDQFIFLTFKCLVNPKLTLEQVKRLEPKVLIEIAGEISKYSGLDRRSVEELRNLLGEEVNLPEQSF